MSELRGASNPTGQGELAVLPPRRCAWLPCSREFTPKPGGHNTHYCPDRDCKERAKAKRLRDSHAMRRGAGTEPAQASTRPPHPYLVATDAAEARLRAGVPVEIVLQQIRADRGPGFAAVVRWALAEREQQRNPGPRMRLRVAI